MTEKASQAMTAVRQNEHLGHTTREGSESLRILAPTVWELLNIAVTDNPRRVRASMRSAADCLDDALARMFDELDDEDERIPAICNECYHHLRHRTPTVTEEMERLDLEPASPVVYAKRVAEQHRVPAQKYARPYFCSTCRDGSEDSQCHVCHGAPAAARESR
jgi:hypothetical protein